MDYPRWSLLIGVVALGLSACNNRGSEDGGTNAQFATPAPPPTPAPPTIGNDAGIGVPRTALHDRRASAKLEGTGESEVKGDAKLEETASGVFLQVSLNHAPTGKLNVVVRDRTDCKDLTAKNLGPVRPSGDLGQITVDKDGNAQLQAQTDSGGLAPDQASSLLNRTLVIEQHGANANEPKPLACGVIRAG